MNSSGSLGDTISWIFAVFILFFLLVLFLVFSGLFNIGNGDSEKGWRILEKNGPRYEDFRGLVTILEARTQDILKGGSEELMVREIAHYQSFSDPHKMEGKWNRISSSFEFDNCYNYVFRSSGIPFITNAFQEHWSDKTVIEKVFGYSPLRLRLGKFNGDVSTNSNELVSKNEVIFAGGFKC